MKYGLNLTWKQLQEAPGAKKLVMEILPGLSTFLAQAPGAGRISLRSLQKYAPELFPGDKAAELEAALREYGKSCGLTAAEQEKVAQYQTLAANRTPAKGTPCRYESVVPGRIWLDTDGKRIEAHGGALYYEDGLYYWYGENKEFTDGASDIWTWGIRMYRSADLYNWEDLGLIAEPDLENPDHPLFPDKYVDRPHIVRCAATGKYVMWIKLSGADSCFVLLQADKLRGPYTLVAEAYHPEGSDVGDFDIITDAGTGKAYLYMDASPKSIAGYELADDYLSVKQKVSSQYEGLMPPFCREGVAMCEHDGKKYMLTSGMSGYTPNQSDAAAAEHWTDSFRSIGDPHVADDTMASFNSQISQVFRLPGTDRYIALADRWMPDHLLDGKSADAVRRAIASRYQPDRYQATAEEQAMFRARPDLERCNTSRSTYVWLPLRFVDGKPEIHWLDEWTVNEL